ncbi:MAG: PhoH family protein [Candidatus Omnitrophica bacterium]|nr:PhoH family protein [Candidatus Omnitrophota bacterium]MDD5488090.1 PhoH family protein [Candidatus Omnitrophota bacterium]
MQEERIVITDDSEARKLFGKHDENLRKVEKALGVSTAFKDGELKITSNDDKGLIKAVDIINEFLLVIRKGGELSSRDVGYSLKAEDPGMALNSIFLDRIEVSSKRAYIAPRSAGQKKYIDAIRRNDIVFCIGPAGTGKTYLAMAMAVNALKKNLVTRIILTRPAVEAGESLGFLPGDMYEKVNPYLRPLYDALYDMVEPHKAREYMEEGIIEVAPLAFMRGRTLNDSYIIMDEAQNSTREQMKMFLTRLGFGAKTVITGDITQSDLPRGKQSGLVHASDLLSGIEGIEFVTLKGEDVVRHELVQEIIKVYKSEEEASNDR